jgi:hypothetical protein
MRFVSALPYLIREAEKFHDRPSTRWRYWDGGGVYQFQSEVLGYDFIALSETENLNI